MLSNLNDHSILEYVLRSSESSSETPQNNSIQKKIISDSVLLEEFIDLKLSINFINELELQPSLGFTDRMMKKISKLTEVAEL
jgi:hypothetical protein